MDAARGRKAGGRLRATGFAFLVIIVPVLLSALNTGANLLYLVVGGLGSFLVLSLVLSAWSLRALTMRRDAPQAVHRGQALPVYLRIENLKPFLPALSLRIERADAPGRAIGYVVRAPARRAVQAQAEVSFDRRGVHPLPAFDLVTSFPFGLLERRRRYADALEVTVYPRVSAVRTSALDRLEGARYTPRSAASDGSEFFSLREYVPGDDMRHIAWRVSARLGVWMVREMAHDTARNVAIVLDTRVEPARLALEYDEDFEQAVDAAASIAVSLLNRQFRVCVATPAGATDPGEGAGQAMRILKFLARAERQSMAPASTALDECVQALSSRQTALLVVSPNPDLWGQRVVRGAPKALDLRELMYA